MEKNRSKLWLALKYLRGQGHGFINRSHWLTIAGITLGVTALICVSSVMNGLRADIRDRITGTLSEIKVTAPGGEPIRDFQPLVD
ncbi:MAG: ABC transporter permease, partial [Candidatus Cloacimonetes bacterium]|nr:ABC transporter permease [Candidatus Cloacimonadota bacterium]